MGLFSTLSRITMGDESSRIASESNPQSNKFLPITTLQTKDFLDESGRELSAMNEAVDREASRLTRALTHLGSGYAFDAVQYSLREIMRNVFEHSGSIYLRYCAQYWPTNRIVELIISDCGMGIYNSLIGNPSFKAVKERDALHFACLPGVSGNAQAMRERASGNPWRNTGYGLYMTSRLCRNNGDFLVISSNHALTLAPSGKKDFEISNVKGTLIRLHLDLTSTQAFRSELVKYTEEGKQIAEGIRGAKVLEASAASQMLRRDFDSGGS
jgi:hypothetical protein